MAMTGAGLAAARKAAIDAVSPVQSNDPADAIAYSEAIFLADSTAIVEYIQANAHATGTDSHGDTHTLPIE